jgi:hypothetical protein
MNLENVESGPAAPKESKVKNVMEYPGFVSKSLDRELKRSPEVVGAVKWYKENLKSLPEITVTEANLTGGGWKAEMTTDGKEVEKVTGPGPDSSPYITGINVFLNYGDRPTRQRTQPEIVQEQDGSGDVYLLTNGDKGDVLLTVGQEPFAGTEKNALVRTPTREEIATLFSNEQIAELDKFKSESVYLPADQNRISAINNAFIKRVDADVFNLDESKSKYRWCNPVEVQALIKAGVVAGSTVAAWAVLGAYTAEESYLEGVRDFALNYYKSEAEKLPQIIVEDAPLTGGGWKAEMTPEGEIKQVTGSDFDIRRVTITKEDGLRTQPAIFEKEDKLRIDGVEMPISGFFGLLTDDKGNVLLTLGQESFFAKNDKRALLRTPFQISMPELNKLTIDGWQEDSNLEGFLIELDIYDIESVEELFASDRVKENTFPLAPVAPDIISAKNLGFMIQVDDPAKFEHYGFWFTPDEVQAFIKEGVVNGHTAALWASSKLDLFKLSAV